MVAAVGVVIAPWAIRNLVQLDHLVVLSVNGDEVLGIANCRQAYNGKLAGFWSIDCYKPQPKGGEVERGAAYRRRGIRYARAHAGRLPYLFLLREGRMWDLYRPSDNVSFGVIEGRDRNVTRVGQRVLWAALPIAAAGLVILRRRRRLILPLVAQLVAVVLTAVLAYGAVRFRVPADIVLVVLLAVVVDALIARLRRESAPARVRRAQVAA
jgi:hypothetical protein